MIARNFRRFPEALVQQLELKFDALYQGLWELVQDARRVPNVMRALRACKGWFEKRRRESRGKLFVAPITPGVALCFYWRQSTIDP